jgi:hypothetical protein
MTKFLETFKIDKSNGYKKFWNFQQILSSGSLKEKFTKTFNYSLYKYHIKWLILTNSVVWFSSFYSPQSQGEWKHCCFGVQNRFRICQQVKLIFLFDNTKQDKTFETKITTLQCRSSEIQLLFKVRKVFQFTFNGIYFFTDVLISPRRVSFSIVKTITLHKSYYSIVVFTIKRICFLKLKFESNSKSKLRLKSGSKAKFN